MVKSAGNGKCFPFAGFLLITGSLAADDSMLDQHIQVSFAVFSLVELLKPTTVEM